MSSTEYINRKIDVAITTNYNGKLEFKIQNKAVTGIQKLVQMFIVELFTSLDSNIFNEKGGTVFGLKLYNKTGGFNSGLISHYISSAISTTIESLSRDPSDYPDENILSATLEDLLEVSGSVTARIYLISQSGSSYSFIVPLNIPVSL